MSRPPARTTDLVDRLPRLARLEFLGKYQAPGRLLAAGFAAGLLLFLGWWSFQPSLSARAGTSASAPGGQSAERAIGDGGGVLDGITGAPAPGPGGISNAAAEASSTGADPAIIDGAPPALDADGNPIVADDTVPGGDGANIDANAAGDVAQAGDSSAPTADPVTLVPFYVEVERSPGVSEVLRIDAVSPEQALGILRDYRGNPHLLRGPSAQPLD